MIINDPIKSTLINKGDIDSYCYIGSWNIEQGFSEFRDPSELIPTEKTVSEWCKTYQELPTCCVVLLISYLYNISVYQEDNVVEMCGVQLTEKTIKNRDLMAAYVEKYSNSETFWNYPLIIDPFFGEDELVYNDDLTWCRIGNEFILLMEESVSENPIFIKEDFYDDFIKETKKLGDLLFK